MKSWKCPECNKVKITKYGVKMKICYCCQVEMKEVENGTD